MTLYLVGNPQDFHVGAHFRRAAESLGIRVILHDLREAAAGPRLVQAVVWRINRRPVRLTAFSRAVAAGCVRENATHVLATGIAPIRRQELEEMQRRGVTTMNFLTDDPWNPRHRAGWFMAALPAYGVVFSTRRQNLDDLRGQGCRAVHYLPFAYCPAVHFPAPGAAGEKHDVDVLFVGGGDADRLPYVRALIANRINVGLYGGVWNRCGDLRPFWRGHADLATQREITPAAKMVLCLVRRANRDGHAMRSYEVPAMQGCILAEDTEEHREMFGPDGEAVVYFSSLAQMIERARWLLAHLGECHRLAAAAHARITDGGNTYADRLKRMLELVAATPTMEVVR